MYIFTYLSIYVFILYIYVCPIFMAFLSLFSLLCDLQPSKGRFHKADLDKLASHTARYALHEIASL